MNSRPEEWKPVTLTGTGPAPPYAALEVVSIADTNGQDVYTVQQPTGASGVTLLFNSPSPLATGQPGAASNRSQLRGLADASSGEVGPVSGEWELSTAAATKTHRVVGGARSGSYRLEKLGGGGTTDPIKTGVVQAGTAATSVQDGNDQTLGTISVWPYLTAAELDRFDPAESYDDDKPVYYTADPHDEATAYSEGDEVASGGDVYRAPSGGVAAGTFDAGDWDLVDSEGVKFAAGSVAAGAYDAADWEDAVGERYIDRTQAAVELEHHFEGDAPIAGALAKWQGTRLIGFTCEAQEGWV